MPRILPHDRGVVEAVRAHPVDRSQPSYGELGERTQLLVELRSRLVQGGGLPRAECRGGEPPALLLVASEVRQVAVRGGQEQRRAGDLHERLARGRRGAVAQHLDRARVEAERQPLVDERVVGWIGQHEGRPDGGGDRSGAGHRRDPLVDQVSAEARGVGALAAQHGEPVARSQAGAQQLLDLHRLNQPVVSEVRGRRELDQLHLAEEGLQRGAHPSEDRVVREVLPGEVVGGREGQVLEDARAGAMGSAAEPEPERKQARPDQRGPVRAPPGEHLGVSLERVAVAGAAADGLVVLARIVDVLGPLDLRPRRGELVDECGHRAPGRAAASARDRAAAAGQQQEGDDDGRRYQDREQRPRSASAYAHGGQS